MAITLSSGPLRATISIVISGSKKSANFRTCRAQLSLRPARVGPSSPGWTARVGPQLGLAVLWFVDSGGIPQPGLDLSNPDCPPPSNLDFMPFLTCLRKRAGAWGLGTQAMKQSGYLGGSAKCCKLVSILVPLITDFFFKTMVPLTYRSGLRHCAGGALVRISQLAWLSHCLSALFWHGSVCRARKYLWRSRAIRGFTSHGPPYCMCSLSCVPICSTERREVLTW